MHTRDLITMLGLDAEYFTKCIAFGHDLDSCPS